ncbi:TLC domain-containing protein [Mycena vulgaris]|nr:TLC domain-containing protein [Mycena vulgaris]
MPFLPEAMRPARNPLLAFFLLSHPVPPPARATAAAALYDSPFLDPSTFLSSLFSSSPSPPPKPFSGQLYEKGLGDLALVAWSVVMWSFLRLVLTRYAFPALARRWGITKEGKMVRFGEQGYAVVYWGVFGVWGVYTLSTTRAFWFRTSYFWEDYPHTHLSGAMKRYYLSQIAYWLQQALVLMLALEKRRSDHWEYVVHHVITVWMVSWSYLMNVTLLGNAVFVSMDIPDTLLALSKLLNYLQLERAKVVSFAVFTVVWTYFRHYISFRVLWSLRYEFHLVPKHAQIFSPSTGLYMALWMRDQMFYTLCILQVLNIFWYYLIWRILVRSIMTSQTDDNRSDVDEEEEVPVLPLEPVEPIAEKGLPPSIGKAADDKLPPSSGRSKSKNKKGAAARTGAGAGVGLTPVEKST